MSNHRFQWRVGALVVLSVLVAGAALAQETPAQPSRKAQLIREFLELTGQNDQLRTIVQQMLEADMDRQWRFFRALMDQRIDEFKRAGHATPQQVTQVEAVVDDYPTQFKKRFFEQIDLVAIILELMAPFLDQHLTEEDLEQLNTFYRSPVAQKLRQLTPSLSQELFQKLPLVMEPKLAAVNQQLNNELNQRIVDIFQTKRP